MPRNGSGTYSLPQPPFVSGTVISSTAMNSDLSDIATALTGSLPRDGQAGMTGQLKLPDGSTLLPALGFTNEGTTGLVRPNTGQMGVIVQGTQVGFFDSGGWEGPTKGGIPIGSLIDFAGSSAPALWVLCFGQAVSRTTYSALFAVIGTTYGAGDGVTTFNLPDFRGRIAAGLDNMGGSAAGNLTSTFYGASPTTLGTAGGAQSLTFLRANLPVINFTNSGISISDPGHSHTVSAVTAGGAALSGGNAPPVAPNSNTVITTSSVGTGVSIGSQGVSSSGGSGTPISQIQPTVVVNKLIYAGV